MNSEEMSDKYWVDPDGKLDVMYVKISQEDFLLLPTQDKIALLDILQDWINRQREQL